MTMNLRAHQSAFSEVIDGIIAGSGVMTVVADVCTGGGKSLLPLIAAAKLIPAGLASKIAWICPRTSLQDQGERVFLDPRFRKELNHNLIIRSSCNDEDCARNTNGIITTYQALAVDYKKTVRRDFERYPYILVADEYHHLAVDGEWTAPIQELYDRAAFRVLLTGTLSRGDQARIAFTPYKETVFRDRTFTPCFDDCKDTAIIRYTRKDALADHAIIPLEFHFADGLARWQKVSGREVEAKLSTSRSDANQALFTALKTEYAEEMLLTGVAHWQDMRKYHNPNGSLLVVAANIETAKEYTAILRGKGLKAEIATSDDTPDAIRHIKALTAGTLKILVSVAMASEGLDVPSISHIICLTNVRTAEWLVQMCGRAVRIDPQAGPYATQKGYIFAPADQMFVSLAAKIEADQCQATARAAKEKDQGQGQCELFGEGGGRPGITPLSSRLLYGQQVPFTYHNLDTAAPEKTQREVEAELREEINRHVLAFCRCYAVKPAHLNKTLKDGFGKARENMTVEELRRLRRHLEREYRVPAGGKL